MQTQTPAALTFTVRTPDGLVATIHGAAARPLHSVLEQVVSQLNFPIPSNQIAFFRFNGSDYDLDKRVSDIAGFTSGDQLALLLRTRAG